jgi:hypothetical protein
LLFERDGKAVERTDKRSLPTPMISTARLSTRLLKKRHDDSIQMRINRFDRANMCFNDLLRRKEALSNLPSDL